MAPIQENPIFTIHRKKAFRKKEILKEPLDF